MTYPALDPSIPNITQTREDSVDASRENIMALRDALIATGVVQGFNYEPAGGSAEQPAQAFYKRDTEWVRVDLTWGIAAGEAGNVVKAAFYYSADTGATFDPMPDVDGDFVLTLAYDAAGNCVGTTWGATP